MQEKGYAMQPKLSCLSWRPLKAIAAKDAPSAVDHISFTSGPLQATCDLGVQILRRLHNFRYRTFSISLEANQAGCTS